MLVIKERVQFVVDTLIYGTKQVWLPDNTGVLFILKYLFNTKKKINELPHVLRLHSQAQSTKNKGFREKQVERI